MDLWLQAKIGFSVTTVANIIYHIKICYLIECHFWIYMRFIWKPGTAVAQWLRCCATNRKVAGSIPAGVSGFFIDIKSFRSHYGPGVDSASNRNEYQKYFLGGNGGRCVSLTTSPPSCAVVTKSGNLNFLEPSGPVQACNGTALLWKPMLVILRFHVPTEIKQSLVGKENKCVADISYIYPLNFPKSKIQFSA